MDGWYIGGSAVMADVSSIERNGWDKAQSEGVVSHYRTILADRYLTRRHLLCRKSCPFLELIVALYLMGSQLGRAEGSWEWIWHLFGW